MKYVKLFTHEVITINDVAYMVIMGLDRKQYDSLDRAGKMRYNRFVYNVQLRSVKYDPNKFQEYYYCKNIEVPPFEKVV